MRREVEEDADARFAEILDRNDKGITARLCAHGEMRGRLLARYNRDYRNKRDREGRAKSDKSDGMELRCRASEDTRVRNVCPRRGMGLLQNITKRKQQSLFAPVCPWHCPKEKMQEL